MSKKKAPESDKPESTNVADGLMKNGETILTANSREELFAKFDELKASTKDVPLSTGAVGRKDDGNFILQIKIVKP